MRETITSSVPSGVALETSDAGSPSPQLGVADDLPRRSLGTGLTRVGALVALADTIYLLRHAGDGLS